MLDVTLPTDILSRAEMIENEACFERSTTYPSFSDFLGRDSLMPGGYRNLPLVR